MSSVEVGLCSQQQFSQVRCLKGSSWGSGLQDSSAVIKKASLGLSSSAYSCFGGSTG